MTTEDRIETALHDLSVILAKAQKDTSGEAYRIISAKDEVLGRFQPIFSLENVGDLDEKSFRDFLLFENNKHWSGLHRLGGQACKNMELLREGLALLVNEQRPLEERLDSLIPTGKKRKIPGFGRALATAILHVVYPDKYGVLNGTSKAGMRALEIWPTFRRGAHLGERYRTVNKIFLTLARRMNIDLWTLDALWWQAKKSPGGPGDDGSGPSEVTEEDYIFGLEKYLHEFLFDNWDATLLGKEWGLYEEDGDLAGYKYKTGVVGEIDLLAKHKKGKRWLVIELKKNQTSDQTIGQVARYMGWVGEELASPGDKVQGLIIAHQSDEKLNYALKIVPDVDLMLYKVDFTLLKQQ